MTPEEKQLLFIDLCARLPYKVQCHIKHIHHLSGWIDEGDVILTGFRLDEFTKETEPLFCNPGGNPKIVFPFDSVKAYLRPMSSMAELEYKEFCKISGLYKKEEGNHFSNHLSELGNSIITERVMVRTIDWLNAHHFDYRGLIPMGLALEAPEEMYKNE